MSDKTPQHFASDNYSGICPEALDAIIKASAAGSAPAYGDDPWTRLAEDAIRTLFGTDAAVFFVFNGTASNALALATLCPPYCSIIATDIAHAETSERGAPEFFTGGSKLMTPPCPDGKLTPAAIKLCCRKAQSPQASAPAVVTITQPTENGLLYTPDDVRALAETCREYGLSLHMDGARLANAVAALGCTPAAITWEAGVDALSFGGTKNGLAVGDAVVFFNRPLARGFAERAKQGGQIASKMRFITAPWLSMIKSGAWLENARHGNACAQLFAAELEGTPGLQLAWPVQSNGVFLLLPEQTMNSLRVKGWRFYTMFGGVARFLFGWDARTDAIKALAADIRACMQL